MFLFVLWHNERFIVDHSHPDWKYYFPVRWLLIPHGLAGLTALLIGPFQLSSRFRQRHLRVQHIMGGFCIASIHGTVALRFVALRFVVFALTIPWLLTAGIAFICVRNGNIQLHRQWMVRSYALTSLFLTGRVVTAIPVIDRAGEAISVPALWSLLLVTLVLTELGLAWRAIFTNNHKASTSPTEW